MRIREILTGNLTTRLVMSSSQDVNITVLTEDTYYFEQRRFLLYFYIVPKCYVILCSNVTGYPQVGYYPTTTKYHYSYTTIQYTTTTQYYQQYPTIPQATYAPPLIADYHSNKNHSKLSGIQKYSLINE